MALAENLSPSQGTRTIKYTHSAATVKNTVYLLGGRVLVAIKDALASAANIFIHFAERVEVVTAASQAWTAGATIYWDNTAAVFTTTSTSNTKCGIAVEDKASTTTTGVIELNNAVNY